ncbi:MAG: SMI1/KNR4 family protein [Bacteroidota bacterium]
MDSRIEEKLDVFYSKNQIALGTKCSNKDIEFIEKSLSVKLTETHKDFLLKYGGSLVGDFAIYGMINSELMDEENIIELTESYKDDDLTLEPGQYVLSHDGSGNPIVQDPSGGILIFDHDIGDFNAIADSLEDLIDRKLSAGTSL